jgi:hypothetical protein
VGDDAARLLWPGLCVPAVATQNVIRVTNEVSDVRKTARDGGLFFSALGWCSLLTLTKQNRRSRDDPGNVRRLGVSRVVSTRRPAARRPFDRTGPTLHASKKKSPTCVRHVTSVGPV